MLLFLFKGKFIEFLFICVFGNFAPNKLVHFGKWRF